MVWNVNDYPESMAGLDFLVRAKAFDLMGSYDTENEDADSILTQSTTEAQNWFDNASEEEKEELRKRYPEDQLNKD